MAKATTSLMLDFESIHLTNHGGWTLLSMAIPAMRKVFEEAYEADAKDQELVRTLQSIMERH